MSSEMREFAGKADALAKRWRDDAKGFRERDMISAADDADFYAEELEAILPSAEADNGLYSPLTGAQEASMRGYCITQLQAVEDEYPDTGKFIREWLTHVENERNRLSAALLARTEAGADLRGGNVRFDVRLKNVKAGADGVVDSRAAFERWAKPQGYRLHIRDMPGSARLGQYGDDSTQAVWEAWAASRTTRPQDASGDAEALQDLMTTVRAVAFSGDYGISDEAISALSDALDDAMQAKEAK